MASRLLGYVLVCAACASPLACGSAGGGGADDAGGATADAPSPEDVHSGQDSPGPDPAADAPCVCGDGSCAPACGETLDTCPLDCRVCGDGTCSPGEGPLACPEDCCRSKEGGAGCGDGTCLGHACGEDPAKCPADCGTACGNHVCDKGETPASCSMDCAWKACGNGVCEPEDGGPAGCPADCGTACGNCLCEKGEGWLDCPGDCGYCGDHVCSVCTTLGETAATCPADCAPVPPPEPGPDEAAPSDVVDVAETPDAAEDPDASDVLAGDESGGGEELKAGPVLLVGFEYTGTDLALDTVDVLLFKQDAGGKPGCADLAPDALPAATVALLAAPLSGTAEFKKLPGLDTDVTQSYTVVGLASDGDGPVRAWGCDDQAGDVEWGKSTFVALNVADLQAKIAGSYEVESTFDMVSGLPPAAANALSARVAFVESPAVGTLVLMCEIGGAAAEDMCGYLFNDPADPQYDELTATGEVAGATMNANLTAMIGPTIYWTGKDLTEPLATVRFLSSFTFAKEPGAGGDLPSPGGKAVWHSVRLRWTLGTGCLPEDDECGWRKFSFAAIPGVEQTISGDFPGSVGPAGLSIGPHAMTLMFGVLSDFALEKWELPMLFGDGSDGLPAVDSWEALLGALMGGKACLMDMSCCETYATTVTNAGTGVSKNVVQGACDALVQTGAAWLRDGLVTLDPVPDNLSLATASPCALGDTNKDGKVDLLGTKAAQCTWAAQWQVGGALTSPVATFRGVRK